MSDQDDKTTSGPTYNEISDIKVPGQDDKPEYAYGEAIAGDVTAI